MGMPTQGERYVSLASHLRVPVGGVVRKENAEHTVRALQGLGEVAAAHTLVRSAVLVLAAQQRDTVCPMMQGEVRVEQHNPAERVALQGEELLHITLPGQAVQGRVIDPIVMVAQHAHYPIPGPEPSQLRQEVSRLMVIDADEVARKTYQVGLETVDPGDERVEIGWVITEAL